MSKQRKLETLHAFQANGVGILPAGKSLPEIGADGPSEDLRPEQAELRRELTRRILHSESFRSAEMLQQLLLYLTQNANSSECGALKEYSIGVEALGRRTDFDPKVDPIVRVQMHRLRQKLREYYAHEGAGDPLVLEIPKGQYLVTFRNAEGPAGGDSATAQSEPHSPPLTVEHSIAVVSSPVQPQAAAPRRGRIIIPLVVGAFLCGLLVAFLWMKVAGTPASSGPVEAFWSQFLGNDRSPIIGYPDAVFLLDDSNDLFRFRQGATDQRGSLVTPDIVQQFAADPALATKAGPLYYENGYTGTGELESVAMLSSLFARMGVRPTIKSSRDITTADFELHDVILLGSPFQNPAVAQLPVTGDFVFDNPDAHRELWRARILNLHARGSEDTRYQTLRDATTGVLKADYGLVSIMQGVAPGFHIAIIGGLDTTGTQGATHFLVSRVGVAKMTDAMSSLENGTSSGFQALLRVNLEKGYEVLDTQMVTLHQMQKAGAVHTNAPVPAPSTAP